MPRRPQISSCWKPRGRVRSDRPNGRQIVTRRPGQGLCGAERQNDRKRRLLMLRRRRRSCQRFPHRFLPFAVAFAPRHATGRQAAVRYAVCTCRQIDAASTSGPDMDLAPRLKLMNWLVSQGLTGLAENDLMRGFCERCRAEGLDLSRGLVFIDTLHPIFEGRGFRWNDTETNESDSFEYGSTGEGDAAQNWRRTTFYHMLENGHDELRIDLADCASLDFAIDRRACRKRPPSFRGLRAPVRRGRNHRPDGLRLFLLGDAAGRRLWRAGPVGAARSGAGAGARDQIRRPGRHRANAGPGLSRPRRVRAGAARADLARRDRAHQRGAVVFRSARLDRDQRKHRARRDHPVSQRLCAGRHRRHPRCRRRGAEADRRRRAGDVHRTRTWPSPSAPRCGPSIVSGAT